MGHRTLKRVPLGFDWPHHKIWGGYVDPHWRKCPDCERGYTPAREALDRLVHLLLIAGAGSLKGKLHPWLTEAGIAAVSPDMAELSTGLAGRPPQGLGHDAVDGYVAARKIIAAAGLSDSWGICRTCSGTGTDPAVKKESDAWEATEPPEGDGWQLWETTSEGSPISPVFATADELAAWCEANATVIGDIRATKEQWLGMLATPDGVDMGSNFILRMGG
jgi:hypothetical protein